MNEDIRFSSSLSLRDGYLFCEDVRIRTLQDSLTEMYPHHSSPCFVYSQNQILDNIRSYRQALDSSKISYSLGYSLKANYNPEIVRLAGQAGCWAVAVSGYEVMLAMMQGIPPGNIILNGNGKQVWEIELAVSNGCLINVDSTFDLDHIAKVTKRLNRKVQVLVRLNPDINADVHPFLATGLAKSKFGTADDELFGLLDTIRSNDNIQLIGLHCHLGSTIDNTFVFSECLEVMISLADKVKDRGFPRLSVLNLGGGLGIDYHRHEYRTKRTGQTIKCEQSDAQDGVRELIDKVKALCRENAEEICQIIAAISSSQGFDVQMKKRLNELLAGHKDLLHAARRTIPYLEFHVDLPTPADLIASVGSRFRESGYHLILEPGRSLVGNAGTLITNVIGVKKNGKQRFIVVDGAMTEVIRPALYGAYHHIELTEPSLIPSANQKNLGEERGELGGGGGGRDAFDVVGPVCECGDFLGKDRFLFVPHEGCGLAMFDVGAYCSSMASNYNMRAQPVEVMVDGSSWRVTRTPGTLDSILTGFTKD